MDRRTGEGQKTSKQEKQVLHTCRLHSAVLAGKQHGDWLQQNETHRRSTWTTPSSMRKDTEELCKHSPYNFENTSSGSWQPGSPSSPRCSGSSSRKGTCRNKIQDCGVQLSSCEQRRRLDRTNIYMGFIPCYITSFVCDLSNSSASPWPHFPIHFLKVCGLYRDRYNQIIQIFAITKFPNSVLYQQGIWLSVSAGIVHCCCKQNSGKWREKLRD